jgi:hypothetical protein
MAQEFIHSVEKEIGDRVLERFGLIMNLGPVEPEGLIEKCLNQAMASEHQRGDLLPFISELGSLIGYVFQQSLFVEASNHRCHRWRSDTETCCKFTGRNNPIPTTLT